VSPPTGIDAPFRRHDRACGRDVDQEIERILDDVRRSEDPNRGVVCSRGCTPGCDHVAYLVEVIRLW
jgi:hypothetical protein